MGKKVSGLKMRALTGMVLALFSWNNPKKTMREFYELNIYHFKEAAQEKILDNYFQNALIPALHRLKIENVGVFKSWANDTVVDKVMYVFVTFKTLERMTQINDELKNDKEYMSAATGFRDVPYNKPCYDRVETILLKAFPLAPQMHPPALHAEKSKRVYELRSYESPTAERFDSKIKMFNEGDEIGLFRKLNFNAIFYSEVIAGSKMPNLMYMTSFENKMDRDDHWKQFVDDPYWKKLSSLPEYQNNVSHIDMSFLYPTDYSDF